MKEKIQQIIKNALNEAKKANNWPDFELEQIVVERTKDEKFGDFTSNIAMTLARKVGKNPMEIVNNLSSQLLASSLEEFDRIEVAAPGYLNFHLSKKYLRTVVEQIVAKKNDFGNSELGKNIKINNEFISANPTGPLTVGNGRGGFYGDSLSRVFRKAGFETVNEYYVNDAGGQIEKLGHSVLKDEQAAYSGEYIDQLNVKYADLVDVREIGKKAAAEILENIIKKTASEKMQISYDVWMSEQKLNDENFDQRAIEILKEKGLTYENEGALWLKTTEFGDDKDRVLIKKDGKNAYIAGDCGYMLNKIERGFERLIISLGADHHGYVSRLKAVAKALGFEGDFRISISQLVRIVKDGKEVRMSKRAGNVVYMDELLGEIGHDVARFFFLMYSPDTHMNFDLGLAKEQSQKNPVFYVQYAHARIYSILDKAKEAGFSNFIFPASSKEKFLFNDEKELSLIKELEKFPELIREISESYEVHKLPHYAIKLADKFHSFYAACKVIDQENPELTNARLILVDSVRIVLGETLGLIGVSAPQKM
jgi:arginyl-tRNA synthetase